MSDLLAPPAAVDIDLDRLAAPGDGWTRLTDREGEVWVHEKEQRVMVIPSDRSVPPSHWGLLQ